MKDSKSILLLVVSVMLILVSCALLWTWGFNFGNFAKENKQVPVLIVKDSVAAANAARDSLKKVYEATISNLGTLDSTWTHADSLKTDLDVKLSEFYKLRNEISVILKNPVKQGDIDLAKQKIDELQRRVNQLRDTNTDIARENKRLYEVLQQLTNVPKEQLQQTVKPVVFENRELPAAEKSIPASVFTATDMRLTALMIDGEKEQETYQALQTDRFEGSFTVKNNFSVFKNTEIVVVVLQPDNKVMQISAWESGRFDTKEGTKVYSCKVKFEYSKGENKRLSFALNADKFQKGTYTLQLYFNGNMIGKTSKTLI